MALQHVVNFDWLTRNIERILLFDVDFPRPMRRFSAVTSNSDFRPVGHASPKSIDNNSAQRMKRKSPRRYLFPPFKRTKQPMFLLYSKLVSAERGFLNGGNTRGICLQLIGGFHTNTSYTGHSAKSWLVALPDNGFAHRLLRSMSAAGGICVCGVFRNRPAICRGRGGPRRVNPSLIHLSGNRVNQATEQVLEDSSGHISIQNG